MSLESCFLCHKIAMKNSHIEFRFFSIYICLNQCSNKESLQKVTVSFVFFGETNLESPFQHQDGIKKKKEKRSLKK